MFLSCEIVSTLLTKVVSFCSYHELITQRRRRVTVTLAFSSYSASHRPIQPSGKKRNNPAKRVMSRRKSTDFRERSRGCSANRFMRISFDCALKKLSRLEMILLDFKCFNLRFERGRRYSQLRGRPEIARDFAFALSQRGFNEALFFFLKPFGKTTGMAR